MNILDDKYLSLRLSAQPEFLLRLHEFVLSHGLAELPALVIQARPTVQVAGFDFSDAAMQQRFVEGIQSDNRWWNGLRSRTGITATFNGIASLPNREHAKWASELHRDGHFIAAVWEFPALRTHHEGEALKTIVDFYATLFADFLAVVKGTIAAEAVFQTTATLVNAPKLHFSTTPDRWGERNLYQPSQIANLQWPIFASSTGAGWETLAAKMGDMLLGACGVQPTPPA